MYGIACYGEHFDDGNNLEIPYELEKDGAISVVNDKIYNLRRKMAEEYTGNENCDIDDYGDLWSLNCLYSYMMKEMCYKKCSFMVTL